MARLNTFVHVLDEHSAAHRFGPADEVPAWAQAAITNPMVWAVLPEPQVVSDVPESPEAPPTAPDDEGADPVPAPSEGDEAAPAEPDEAPAKPARRTRKQ